MEVLITGIGDAFTARYFGSSGLIRSDRGLVAIDCPGAVMAMYRQAAEVSGWAVDATDVADILLTHLHGDHSDGLETLGFANRYLRQPPRRPRLHALPEVLDRVWEKLGPAMDGATKSAGETSTLSDYFEPCPIEPGEIRDVGGLSVQCRRGVHSLPCMALRIEREGCSLAWSGDTEFVPELIDWLAEADVVVHECGEQFKHTRYADLATLPLDLQGRIRLIHLPDGADVPLAPLRPLLQGEVLEIQSRD
ncbi:MAG: MBL fold metallo-hydrolase [Phycisphaerales bacterium]|nr:MBL fold metallo-hydrolase [Phycisphaerales bacterium]